MDAARRFFVSGRVQGVFFRAFTREAARSEGVRGFACNLPDGRVEVYAEGSAAALDALERRLRTGPPAARVDDVGVTAESPVGADDFRVTD